MVKHLYNHSPAINFLIHSNYQNKSSFRMRYLFIDKSNLRINRNAFFMIMIRGNILSNGYDSGYDS